MKMILNLGWLIILPLFLQGQYSLKSYTVSASGGAQSTSAYTLNSSVQAYEASENSNANYSGNTGFLHPTVILIIPDIELGLKAYLEGPYNGSGLNTDIKNIIPANQPYNVSPWMYSGTESFTSLPNENIVDWVLVELRDAPDAASADDNTIVAIQAGFLLNDGSIVAEDGSSNMSFDLSISQNLYVVVYHRNHIAVLSNYALTQSGGVYSYDFTNDAGQAYGGNAAHKNLGAGIYGLFSGDANVDGKVDLNDKTIWANQSGEQGYKSSDFNLDGQISNPDKNEKWLSNNGEESQVPE
jgi:hypothetical protein